MIAVIGKLARLGVRMSFGALPESLVSFLIVGSLGVVVHLCILKMAMITLIPDFKYANLAAMLVAASFNFFINNKSTFSDQSLVGRHALLGYLVYVGITAVGLTISLYISTHVYAHNGMPMIAALCGIAIGSAWNYLMSYTFVWRLIFHLSRQRG